MRTRSHRNFILFAASCDRLFSVANSMLVIVSILIVLTLLPYHLSSHMCALMRVHLTFKKNKNYRKSEMSEICIAYNYLALEFRKRLSSKIWVVTEKLGNFLVNIEIKKFN